ncbi:GntR family transcriptional regulator [Bradyrhizobium sp. dw_411]|uniref:GntR family transcriptional regulator n=1 Tax=Bradyrhizobium sp. dw_411 TaxID=2720082 RepID=UPI001BCE8B1B|nr:GntR family transcriptional regulator [Bradyrhizobium sp. dw_411]
MKTIAGAPAVARATNSTEEPESLSAGVVHRLEVEILKGQRKPGDRLDERQLAEQYGVSRTPVREALQRLAASGLVVSRGRQGLQVAQLSIADLLDAFSVAAEMEALASAQAARRIRPEQRTRLEAAHHACAAAAQAGDVDGFYEANLEFHETISTASHNRILQDELRRLTVKISPYRRTITYQPGRMESSIPEHEQIMIAIFRGEPMQASLVMRSHVTLLGEGLSDLLHFLRVSGDQNLLAELA